MIVSLHVWRVPTFGVPAACARVAAGHALLRRVPDLRFGKMLGTGAGRTFTVRDATPRRWALLTAWDEPRHAVGFDSSAMVRSWDLAADERWRILLEPLSVRGRWSRREPFGSPAPTRSGGPVAALTRARIAPAKMVRFWRAVPPVSADLHAHGSGLLFAMGIGEAPIGLQGTFSLWSSAAELTAFAHRGAPHVEAIRRTAQERWYAEELFARFAVLEAAGRVDGRDPLAAVGLVRG